MKNKTLVELKRSKITKPKDVNKKTMRLKIEIKICASKTALFANYTTFNKLIPVFHASVLLLIMNFVMTLLKQLWIHEVIAEWICGLL